jgi:hypothetical protein
MNPKYLWLADAIQLLTLFVVEPVIAIVIAYAAWRGKPRNFTPQRYGLVCIASSVSAALLLVLAKWINADVRTSQYFLQLGCFLLGFMLLGAGMGSFFAVLLQVWRWHKVTRLAHHNPTEP